tara:strand:+ start:371 stop:643 length:273 start_codon:yes stop_codon:yes gene_type:complete
MTLRPSDSIDIIEKMIKGYRYDMDRVVEREEEPDPISTLMDIHNILENSQRPFGNVTYCTMNNPPSHDQIQSKKCADDCYMCKKDLDEGD